MIEVDFQSIVYNIDKTWEEFKEYIISEEYEVINIVGTMIVSIKPRLVKVTRILINDDFHLRVIFSNGIESKFYLVKDENFNRLWR